MRVEEVAWEAATLRRRDVFRIASAPGTDEAPNVFVRVVVDGTEGWGVATPNHVTAETVDTIAAALPRLAAALREGSLGGLGDAARVLDEAVPGQPAAKAGVDLALHDAVAQAEGVPLHRLLGPAGRDDVLTDMTIPLLEFQDAVERALHWTERGFRALKVKVGQDPAMDARVVRAIREAVGPEVALRVDANEGYDLPGALRFLGDVRPARLECFEQPVPRADLLGMQALTLQSPVPILADEAVFNARDVMTLKWGNCCHLINVKLMKAGGLRGALAANTVAESAAFPVLVGCMGEPQVSIAAALHFAAAQPNVRFADLDSWLHLVDDPSRGLHLEASRLRVPQGPGLGVAVDL